MFWVALGFLVLEFAYAYYTRPPPPGPPKGELSIPLCEQGATIPLLYGRVRVQAPILAYTSDPIGYTTSGGLPQFFMDMHFVLGIPCENGSSRIFNMWAGDNQLSPNRLTSSVSTGGGNPDAGPEPEGSLTSVYATLPDLVGDGLYECGRTVAVTLDTKVDVTSPQWIRGCLEFYNGNTLQHIVYDDGTPATIAGKYMTKTTNTGGSSTGINDLNGHVPGLQIPGYRGYASVFLWSNISIARWLIGISPQIAAYSFEVGSYPQGFGNGLVGNDMNPADVIYDLLTGTFGKLGMSTSLLDNASFVAAAVTLGTEGHGFSRAFDQASTTAEMVGEVLQQIDGILFENPSTGLMTLKLIRADYDPSTLPVITPANCKELQGFSMSGRTELTNRVVITFANRQEDYKVGTAVAYSQANAVGQSGEVHEIVISMPGITTQALADQVAGRELQSRSRPMMKCRAIVSRAFLRTLPGDPIRLTWPEAGISLVVFRVVSVSHGSLESGAIILDLIQDLFYQWARERPVPPPHFGLGSSTTF